MMRAVKSQIIQTKTVLAVPKGGEAEPQARVTIPEGRPKGIVHFIGGAVVGAAPQLSYKFFINRIASNGYTVIQTPYPFTFSHESLANDLFMSYLSCLKNMRESGMEAAVPENVPTHGIGHSNGSLMHLLIGSFFQEPFDSNVLLSYNNKEVDDAIPIPGFVSTMRPLLQQGRERGIYMSKEDIRQRCLDVLQKGPMPVGALGFSGDDLGPLLSQLSSCLEEIESGVTNFNPTPAESRMLIASRYTIPQLLMIKFADDGIDETPDMLRLLRQEQVANRAMIQDIILPGNHTTPCLGPDETNMQSNLTVGSLVGAAASLWNYNDLTKTCETVNDWLDRY